MMLTTSDVHTYVTQGIRARYGKLVDPAAVFNAWLAEHDQQVIDAALAFTPTLITPDQFVERLSGIAECLRGDTHGVTPGRWNP